MYSPTPKETLYTVAGLTALSQITHTARGDRSFRQFEKLTGISHAALRRLELAEVKNPDDTTLAKLAPYTPYNFEELKAIAQERTVGEKRKFLVAEELMPMVNELPVAEMVRLGQMILSRLARLLQENVNKS